MKVTSCTWKLSLRCLLAFCAIWLSTAQGRDGGIPAVADGIVGRVTGPKGPEAGVWVIAETADLPTRFIKIVVTDDQGRYVLPELPKANYKVWVRGYGLIDSKPVERQTGSRVDLTATEARDAKAAAQYYPPNYWSALLHAPAADEFPGTGPEANGIPNSLKTQQQWLGQLKDGCQQCHQLGDKATRELADNSAAGWAQRIQMARPLGDSSVGDRGQKMSDDMQMRMELLGRERALNIFADWTRRIAEGEIPPEAPPRPTGVERNLVLTLWDWGDGSYHHDEIATDRRAPVVNAGGPVYGVRSNTGFLDVLDVKKNRTNTVPLPGISPPPAANSGPTASPSHDINAAYPHTLIMDRRSRLWISVKSGVFVPSPSVTLPDFCSNGHASPFAKHYPIYGKLTNGVEVYDPSTGVIDWIPTCFNDHHLAFANDKNDTLYLSGDFNVVGWIDTKVWDETHDPEKAQGWCPLVLDTSKSGTAGSTDPGQWNEFGKSSDPAKDTQIKGRMLYGLDVNFVDNSVWFAMFVPYVPSALVRFERGSHPPETCRTEYYEPPKLPDGSYVAFNSRGVGIDSQGVAWVPFGSGKLASFDRKKCKVTSGPTATGQHCPEGWTFYTPPGPTFNNTTVKSDWFYLGWVDLYNTLGLGKGIPLMPGSMSDSLTAFLPSSQKFITLRVPYPMGFYTRGLDGRIDNASAGWKGRGLWATYSDIPVWHQEDGEDGSGPELVKFQIRPDPLAH